MEGEIEHLCTLLRLSAYQIVQCLMSIQEEEKDARCTYTVDIPSNKKEMGQQTRRVEISLRLMLRTRYTL